MTYTITAPLPGRIWEIKVKVGQQVSEDEVVLILEAMKMENEISANQSGTIKKILVEKDQVVKVGEALIEVE